MSAVYSRYPCSICHQTFSRNEHLLRHQVKHASVRAYKCKTCLQTFNRGDALKRHESIHKAPEPASVIESERNSSGRKHRTQIACDNCAKAKIRCNGQIPCEPCLAKYKMCTLNRPHTAVKRRRPLPSPPSLDLLFEEESTVVNTQSHGHREKPSQLASPITDQSTAHSDEHGSFNSGDLTISNMRVTTGHPESPDSQSPNFDNVTPDNAQDLSFLDKTNSQLWSDMYSPLYAPSPFRGENFSQFLWFPEETASTQSLTTHTTSHQPADPRFTLSQQTDNIPKPPDKKPPGDPALDPYASNPHVHYPKKGPIVKVAYICDFLHDTRSWTQINHLENRRPSPKSPAPVLLDGIRDTLSARVHVMLSKALDQDAMRKIPHLFPPLSTIQALFAEYYRRYSLLYPIVHPSAFFEPNWAKDEAYNDIGLFLSALLVLGALTIPVQEAQLFAVELAFLIRNMINETMTRDENQMNDMWTLSTSLLMTVFSAWSGNKRHAELAEAFRGAFSTAFLRRGYFKSSPISDPDIETRIPSDWRTWLDREQETRLGHVWYIVEQEISLFHCLSPTIHFADMRRSMPVDDSLFFADNEDDWRALVQNYSEDGNLTRKLAPPSLATLYWRFIRHDFLYKDYDVTPLHLRLLLCTIQTQVTQFSQSNRFVSTGDSESDCDSWASIGAVASLRQEELQTLLTKWHILRQRVLGHEIKSEIALACKLMYHLIWLELFICFNDVQLIAGKEGHVGGKPLILQLERWTRSLSASKALGHVGQIVKAFQNPAYDALRPIWWPVALSRIALILFAYGSCLHKTITNGTTRQTMAYIALNDNEEDQDVNGKVIQAGEGIPCLRTSEGLLVPISQVPNTLDFCLDILERGKNMSSPICVSMHRFLQDIKRFEFPWTKD